jgi:hypothetical protein
MASRVARRLPKTTDSSVPSVSSAHFAWLSRTSILQAIVLVLSLALYGNTLTHEFTFDDVAAVVRNPVVVRETPSFSRETLS